LGLRAARSRDVLFANGLYEEAALVSLISRKPLVCKVVGNPAWESLQLRESTDSSTSSLEEFDPKRLSFFLRVRHQLWKLALSRATLLITPSHSLKRHLESLHLGSPIQVIENGTTIPVLESELHKYEVVTISRLVPWKNLDVLIQAAREHDFRLAIAGDGPDLSRLVRLAEADSRISFLGRLESSQIGTLLRLSRIYALVSTYEGLSYSLIEALAHGKACVVSDNQGNMDALHESHAAVVVPVGDVASTGQAITGLLSDVDLRKSLEGKARLLAMRNYDKNQQLEKVCETLDAVF